MAPRQQVPPIPDRTGPCRFGRLGDWITTECPRELDQMRNAGGMWDPDARRSLLRRHRIGPVLRTLRRRTDPLFRQAGVDLDDASGIARKALGPGSLAGQVAGGRKIGAQKPGDTVRPDCRNALGFG